MTIEIGGYLLTAILALLVALLLREWWRFRAEALRRPR